jgi:hypothetical protein
MGHPCCRSLKHCRHCAAGLDHPKLLAFRLDEYVVAWAAGKRECSSAVCRDRIGSWRSAGTHDRTIYADRGERTNQCAVSIEVDAFYDGFWLRDTANDVPPVCGEQIRALQSVHAATRHAAVRPRGAGRHYYCDQAHQRTRKE